MTLAWYGFKPDHLFHKLCQCSSLRDYTNGVILCLNWTFHQESVPYDIPLVVLQKVTNFFSTYAAFSDLFFEFE